MSNIWNKIKSLFVKSKFVPIPTYKPQIIPLSEPRTIICIPNATQSEIDQFQSTLQYYDKLILNKPINVYTLKRNILYEVTNDLKKVKLNGLQNRNSTNRETNTKSK